MKRKEPSLESVLQLHNHPLLHQMTYLVHITQLLSYQCHLVSELKFFNKGVDYFQTKEVESSICDMYGYSRQINFDKVQAIMRRKMVGTGNEIFIWCKVDFALLPSSDFQQS